MSLSMLSPRLTLLLTVATPALMAVGTLMGSALRKLSRQCQEQVRHFPPCPLRSPFSQSCHSSPSPARLPISRIPCRLPGRQG